MTNKEMRESLKRAFLFLDELEYKGIVNANRIVATAQIIKALDDELDAREKEKERQKAEAKEVEES